MAAVDLPVVPDQPVVIHVNSTVQIEIHIHFVDLLSFRFVQMNKRKFDQNYFHIKIKQNLCRSERLDTLT